MEKDNQKFENIMFWNEGDGILAFSYKENLEIDLSIAKQLVEQRLEFTSGKSVFALVDFTNVKSVTKQARDYMNSPDGGLKGIKAGAFLSNNVVGNLFINLYLNINKPSIPAKFFKKKDDALVWLTKIMNETPISK